MNTTDPLITAYPSFAEQNNNFELRHFETNCVKILQSATNINNDTDELRYLNDLHKFMNNNLLKITSQIQNKIMMINKTNNFNIDKVKNLPDDIIGEIKSYLEPEISYVKKLTLLREIRRLNFTNTGMEHYLDKVPKKLIISLLNRLYIFTQLTMLTKDSKARWCMMIVFETDFLFHHNPIDLRIDKLLANYKEEYSKKIDKWRKFFLYIHTFKKYRANLERRLKKTDERIKLLKFKKIVVK